MKIDWIFFPQSIIEKAIFPINKCYGRSDDHDHDDDKMVNPFSRKL